MSSPISQCEFAAHGAMARSTLAEAITASGIQADYVLHRVRQQIVIAYPGMSNISNIMNTVEPYWRQPGQSHCDLHKHRGGHTGTLCECACACFVGQCFACHQCCAMHCITDMNALMVQACAGGRRGGSVAAGAGQRWHGWAQASPLLAALGATGSALPTSAMTEWAQAV